MLVVSCKSHLSFIIVPFERRLQKYFINIRTQVYNISHNAAPFIFSYIWFSNMRTWTPPRPSDPTYCLRMNDEKYQNNEKIFFAEPYAMTLLWFLFLFSMIQKDLLIIFIEKTTRERRCKVPFLSCLFKQN